MIWTTKSGEKIDIRHMSTSHLKNAIAMLERKSEAFRNEAISSGHIMLGILQGEMAIDSVERELDWLEGDDFDLYDHDKTFRALVDEEERREREQ